MKTLGGGLNHYQLVGVRRWQSSRASTEAFGYLKQAPQAAVGSQRGKTARATGKTIGRRR
jgi:hypothetical protein